MTENQEKKTEGEVCGCGNGSCCSGAGKWIWIVLAIVVAGVLIAKNSAKKDSSAAAVAPMVAATAQVATVASKDINSEPAFSTNALPRLVDLGAGKCIPCKMMAPILEDLKKTYVGKLDVQFFDVWEKPDEAKKYGVNIIPTQIFYDVTGKELFRHEGFFSREDILAKWKMFGVDFGAK